MKQKPFSIELRRHWQALTHQGVARGNVRGKKDRWETNRSSKTNCIIRVHVRFTVSFLKTPLFRIG